MTKFTIKTKEAENLSKFAKHLGKLNGIAPINPRQLFVFNNTKLEIFVTGEDGSASTIQGEIVIELTNPQLDPNQTYFCTELEGLLKAIEKFEGKDVDCTLNASVLSLTAQGTKLKIENKLIGTKTEDEIKGIKLFIDTVVNDKLHEDTRINIDFSNIRKSIIDLASFSKVYSQMNSINIGDTTLKVADNLGIFSETLTTPPPVSSSVRMHRDLSELIENSKLTFTSLATDPDNPQNIFWYFNMGPYGRILLAQPPTNYVYPSEQDLISFLPLENHKIKLEISTQELFKAIKKFDGLFSSDTWNTYNQVNFKTPVDFSVNKKLELSWYDNTREINNELEVTIVEQTDSVEGFEFCLATKQLKELEDFFNKGDDSKIYMEYASAGFGKPNGTGVKIYNDTAEFILPKMISS